LGPTCLRGAWSYFWARGLRTPWGYPRPRRFARVRPEGLATLWRFGSVLAGRAGFPGKWCQELGACSARSCRTWSTGVALRVRTGVAGLFRPIVLRGRLRQVSFFVVVVLSLSPLLVASQLTEQWYQEACDDGVADACNVFGSMYLLGEGVTQDLTRAARLFERACEGGMLVGCANLGRMYEAGAGVPEDVARANELYRVACEGGELWACDLGATDRTRAATLADRFFSTGEVGRINGRVTDERGDLGLSDVEITVLGQEPVRTISSQRGRFSLRDLPPGRAELPPSGTERILPEGQRRTWEPVHPEGPRRPRPFRAGIRHSCACPGCLGAAERTRPRFC